MRKMKWLLFTLGLTLSTLALKAQEQGIQFEKTASWAEVQAKAKAENKYIFIDCYATWCVPCKKMDEEVYPNDTIGQYVNQHFISVKFQFDVTKNDAPEVKARYADANAVNKLYKITELPTFLFFTPDGKLTSSAYGGRDVKSFLELAKDVLDVNSRNYRLKVDALNQLLWSVPAKSIPITAKPNWSSIKSTLNSKYGDNQTDFLILLKQVNFYARTGDWTSFAKVIEKAIRQFPPKAKGRNLNFALFGNAKSNTYADPEGLNTAAWFTFQGSNDPKILNKALAWSELSTQLEAENGENLQLDNYLDTKANILYKLGRKDEAIRLYENIVKRVQEKVPNDALAKVEIGEFLITLEKMKKGEKTW